MNPDTIIHLELNIKSVDTILNMLADLPFKQSSGIIADIQKQAQVYLQSVQAQNETTALAQSER